MASPIIIEAVHRRIAELETQIAQLHECIILIAVYAEAGCLEEYPTPVNPMSALAFCIRRNEELRHEVARIRRKYNIAE